MRHFGHCYYSECKGVWLPENETESVDFVGILAVVTEQTNDLFAFRDRLALPIACLHFVQGVDVACSVLDTQAVDALIIGHFDADLGNGNGTFLTWWSFHIEHNLLSYVHLGANTTVEGLALDIASEEKLDGSQRAPVGSNSLELNLTIKVPLINLIHSWPLKGIVVTLSEGTKGCHLLELGLPGHSCRRIGFSQLLLHPGVLVRLHELFFHLALGLHEGLDLALDELIEDGLLLDGALS